MVSSGETTQNDWDGVTTEKTYELANCQVTLSLTSYWEGGYNADVKIQNTSEQAIENWYLCCDLDNKISNIWDAEINSHENGVYVIKNAGWNQDIAVGQSVEFGISVNETFAGFSEEYMLLGESTQLKEDAYSVEYILDNDWETGFTARVIVSNNTEEVLEDWTLEFDFDREIRSIWNGVIESHEGNHYVIKNAGYNANIATGQSVSFGFQGEGGKASDALYAFSLYTYELYNGDSMELDTDNDGVYLGFSPLLKDTDGNGIIDSNEKIEQVKEVEFEESEGNGITKVSVTMQVSENVNSNINISNIYGMDMQSSNVVGLVGVPVEIHSAVNFDLAEIAFYYDESAIGDVKEEDFAVLWYDEENEWKLCCNCKSSIR